MSSLTDRHFFIAAVIFYGVSMFYSFFLWRKGFREDNRLNYGLLLTGFLCHTTAMFYRGLSLQHCPLGNLYEAMVFVAWSMVGAYLVIGSWARLRFLGAFASPIVFAIGVFALLALYSPQGNEPGFRNGLIILHAALILLSYGAFGLGSITGIMYVTQEHDLKFHKLRAVFSLMPSMERLEKVMTRLLWAGFILLTLGLSFSPFLMKQRFGVYFQPEIKTLWSMLVWAVYLSLLIMHSRFAQSGRRFAWGNIGSFVFVLLTFWGVNLLSTPHN